MIRIITFLAYLFLSTPAFANIDDVALAAFKSYLASLKSVAIDFEQKDLRGEVATGTLIIAKPHKFMCNYYPPYPLIVIGNKTYVSIYDFDLEQLTRIDTKDNMFNFLLTSNVELEEYFSVLKAANSGNEIEVELYHSDLDRTTSVVISLNPTKLKAIITEEADGNVISLYVKKVTAIKNVDDSLFVIKNPDIYGVPQRLDTRGLRKLYSVE